MLVFIVRELHYLEEDILGNWSSERMFTCNEADNPDGSDVCEMFGYDGDMGAFNRVLSFGEDQNGKLKSHILTLNYKI